jgi:hypothetical protein
VRKTRTKKKYKNIKIKSPDTVGVPEMDPKQVL